MIDYLHDLGDIIAAFKRDYGINPEEFLKLKTKIFLNYFSNLHPDNLIIKKIQLRNTPDAQLSLEQVRYKNEIKLLKQNNNDETLATFAKLMS
ncbi:bacteriophage Gp15 protein [Mycoplasmopsis mustelae]|uniref:Bacteriophage Gp15 protein n=1 Tax=Mycoplasmopsis mustelae TaxID=171289 RepID=A0A4R7UC56_9BACT|nr:Gp15 family bacteriophage protein [Mycoplasmopsis mustelae]TDV23507.1 bacteriophage Gp15 protein [Mycoplasmopsis mustelae]